MVAGLATLQAFDEEGIVERAAATGSLLRQRLEVLVDRYEMLHEVRGKGLMIGLEFGEPSSRVLRRRWQLLERMRPALFSQSIVIPLFHRHRILTQVAADGINVVKLLPPLVAGEAEVDRFVDALDDVLHDAHQGPGLLLEVGRTVAKSAVRRGGPRHRVPASTNGHGPGAAPGPAHRDGPGSGAGVPPSHTSV
jgi:ornithine--oxo-acid transaminase